MSIGKSLATFRSTSLPPSSGLSSSRLTSQKICILFEVSSGDISGGLRKATKDVSQDCPSPDTDLNLGLRMQSKGARHWTVTSGVDLGS